MGTYCQNKTIRFLCLCMSLEFTPNCAASDNQALKCTVIQGPYNGSNDNNDNNDYK